MDENELLEIVEPIVARRARRARLNDADREDLQQDVVLKYLRAFPGRTAPDNVAAWFETAIERTLIDRYRADQRHPAEALPEDGEDPVSTVIRELTLAKATSLWAVREKLIRSILGLIPDEDADLLEQRYLDGCSAADVADRLGLEANNVDQRTTRAKRRLREALGDRPDLVEELRSPHPRLY